MTIRVLIVDDQALFRAGIAMILGTQPDLQVTGEFGSGEEAVEYVRSGGEADVILMDVQMPGIGGVAATAAITDRPSPPRVLVLTTFDDSATVMAAIAAGASGFVLKDAKAELLLSSVRSVAAGTEVLALSSSLRDLARREQAHAPLPAAFEALTPSEQTVLRHAAAGLSNGEIAEAAFLSEATVKSYVSRVLTKLGLRDRAQLVLFAVRHGLID